MAQREKDGDAENSLPFALPLPLPIKERISSAQRKAEGAEYAEKK